MVRPLLSFIILLQFFIISIVARFEFQLINDIVRNENVPVILNLRTCWTKIEKHNFLSNSSVLIQFIKSANISSNEQNNNWFVLDLECPGGMQFLQEVDEKYLRHPFRWIILNPSVENVIKFKELPLLIDNNNILAQKSRTSDKYVLEQFYKFRNNSQDIFTEHFGEWEPNVGINDRRSTRILSRLRRNLKEENLAISIVALFNDTLEHLHDYQALERDAVTKANYLITSCLIDAVNGTRILYSVENTWADIHPRTQEPLGVWGQLVKRNIDIGSNSFFMTPQRVKTVDYISMITSARIRFIFRSPPLTYTSNIYYLPFTGLVWVSCICLIILCTFVVYFTLKSNGSQKNQYYGDYSQFFLVGIGVVCQMGTQLNPKRISGRIAILFFCIALLFIYTSYTANIVALLQSTSNTINTLEDLLESRIELAADDKPFNRHWLPRGEGPTRKSIYHTRIAPPNEPSKFYNLTYGIARMRKDYFAFNVEIGPAYKLIQETFYENEKCGLKEIDYLNQIDPWMAVQKNSPIREIIKVNAFKIREHGLQQRLNQKIYRKRPVCEGHEQNFGSVRIIDCYAALLVLAYGYIISILLLTIERFMWNCHLKPKIRFVRSISRSSRPSGASQNEY